MSKIEPLGDPARHFWMTRSVARVMGVSLSDAMAEGHLTTKGYANLVTNCRRCTHVDACEYWLAHQAGEAEAAPEGCLHARLFEELKDVAGKA